MNFLRESPGNLNNDIYYYLYDFFREFLNDNEATTDLLRRIIRLVINKSNYK